MDLMAWLGVIVAFAIFEAVTLDMTAIWFAFGGIIAMISACFTTSLTMQFSIFIIFAGICLIFFRPMCKKYLLKSADSADAKTNIDMIIGQTGVVTVKIGEESGEVKVAGKIWTSLNETQGETILEGEKVEILQIKGSKLIVKAIKNNI